jgi:hypothetical protein
LGREGERRARLVVGEARFPVVPSAAISGRAPSERLFVVTRDWRVEERVVSSGDHAGTGVTIVKGLAAGELVVAAWSPVLRDGVRVK